MARASKNDAGAVFILVIAIVAIIVLIIAALVTPAVAIIGYFYNSIKANKIKRNLSGNMSDFWLNEQEKIDFKEKTTLLFQAEEAIDQANQKGENAGISRNKDGSFSARSNLGKEIRAILGKYQPIKNTLLAHLNELELLPISRWENFNKYVKNKKAFLWAFCLWVATLILLLYCIRETDDFRNFYTIRSGDRKLLS